MLNVIRMPNSNAWQVRCPCGYAETAETETGAEFKYKWHLADRHVGPAAATSLTDDQLRAECERRGLGGASYLEFNAMSAARDAAIARAQAAERRADLIDPKLGERYALALTERFEIVKDRDEWRCRAEAAEAESERRRLVIAAKNEMLSDLRAIQKTRLEPQDRNPVRAARCANGQHCTDHTDGLCCGCGKKGASRCDTREDGPGLSMVPYAPPDNSSYFLDVDLLADDA